MKDYRKLVMPLVGILYVLLKRYGIEIPFAENDIADFVVSLGVAAGVWGLKNG